MNQPGKGIILREQSFLGLFRLTTQKKCKKQIDFHFNKLISSIISIYYAVLYYDYKSQKDISINNRVI
ncbi:unnamed protein product [Paramecium primaurelia]|uniref:Uncharacterized protein n=1 Tax=Paramecium primaurelia TaxID=5886 RepID=A0A8S1Q4N3_PARPR|nr:unnamed protein product [Paramecium primaurelia]CAD8110628.1 unnamed protein product [Paramecium primaurelia]